MMERYDPSQLCAELIQLVDQQINSLEQLTDGSITEGDTLEYDERRNRIHQLVEEITNQESPSAISHFHLYPSIFH
jgi:hypothetical protein